MLEALGQFADSVRILAVEVEPGSDSARARAGMVGVVARRKDQLEQFGIKALPTVLLFDRAAGTAGRWEGYSPLQVKRIGERISDVRRGE